MTPSGGGKFTSKNWPKFSWKKRRKLPEIFIGIDPGLTGGIGGVDREGEAVFAVDLPVIAKNVDGAALVELLKAYHGALVVVEGQQAFPRQGAASGFRTGVNYGIILGALSAAGIPYAVEPPQRWLRALGLTSDKERVLLEARRRWPAADLPLKRHEGRAHALWLAEYARLKRDSATPKPALSKQ